MQVNVNHNRVIGEDREFTEDSVKTGRPFKQSKSGNATAAAAEKQPQALSQQARYGMLT